MLMLLGQRQKFFDPDAAAYGAASGATGSYLAAVNTFILAEKASGTWALTDDYWALWAPNATAALTSLKQRRLATVTAAPTFTADRDYTFNGSTQYIDTGFVPSTHAVVMTGTSQRLGVYERTNVSSSGFAAGSTATTTRRMTLTPRNTTTMGGSLNTLGGTGTFTLGTADSRGLKVISRAAGGLTLKGYDRGVALTDAVAASVGTTLPEYSLFIGGNNNLGVLASARAASVGFVVIGAPLSDAQEAAQYANIQALATARGAEV